MLVLTLESKAASWGESIGRNREAEALRWLTEICSLSPDQLADQQERFFERFPSGLYAHRKGRHDMVSAAKRILGYSNYLMGRHYEYGRGVSRDIVKSTKYYQTASGYGNPDAQDCLGVCYALGLGVEQDYSKAVQMFRKLADHRKFGKGAQCNLGFCYKNGMGVKRDYRLAAIWYGKAADRSFDETLKEDGGDPMAQYQLGLCYEYGLGVPRDGAKAFYWYDRAAKTRVSGETFFDLNLYHLQPASFRRNNAKDENKRRKLVYNMIQCKIADCYAHGVGVGKDLKEAERLYRFVGEDDPEAMCRLGKLYVVGGSGVEKNVIEAVRLFRLAARGNHREAQYNLGYCYENGLGVRPDDKMALFWYMQSADNGDADAQYKVAKYNQGIFNNAKDAASYFAKAAGQGHAESQYELGVCYRDGKGVEKDVNESRKWFSLAAKQKNQDAVTALEKMESPKPAQGK
ncbi:MAG: hypothetical protein MJ025_06945 [Victivallaceae bacterium]|nr:hypothetical protein [Victivallaceae bacterium]